MTIAIDVLVCTGVAVAILSAWLMVRMRDEYQMLHFMSPAATVAPILITAAVIVQQKIKPESFKAVFITLVLLTMNMTVTHATARAFRIRETRQNWRPRKGEEVPILSSDERLEPPSTESK